MLTKEQIEDELKLVKFHASVNLDYHHYLVWQYGWFDRSLKIVLGVLSVIGFTLSVYDFALPNGSKTASGWGVVFGLVSILAAVLLNVLPFDRLEQEHSKFYARWSDLHREILGLLLRLRMTDDADELAAIADRLPDFVERQNSIDIDEPPTRRSLMDWAEENENERTWGVRNHDLALKKQEEHRAQKAAARQATQQLVP